MTKSREYICKLCGTHTTEDYVQWKKKPQKAKNHCPDCLYSKEVKKQTRREMAWDNPYSYIR